jgi:hypothetical protein
MAKFKMTPLVTNGDQITARLGSASGSANYLVDAKERGKFVKLAGDSRFDLCAAGDPIEGAISSIEVAPMDDFAVGTVQTDGRLAVVLDGLQATPGTGAVAIGDYVVVGTAVAKDTALTAAPKVTKATQQPGSVPADLTAAGLQARNAIYAWRVVAASGTAVGSTAVIERVNC